MTSRVVFFPLCQCVMHSIFLCHPNKAFISFYPKTPSWNLLCWLWYCDFYFLVHVTLPCKVKLSHLYTNEGNDLIYLVVVIVVTSCLWPWHTVSALNLLILFHPRGSSMFFWDHSVSVISKECRHGSGFHGNPFQTASVSMLCCFLYLLLWLHFCERHWSLQHIVNMHTNHQPSS